MSFLFKPVSSICSTRSARCPGDCVLCRREVFRRVEVEEESECWAGQGRDSESSASPRFVGLYNRYPGRSRIGPTGAQCVTDPQSDCTCAGARQGSGAGVRWVQLKKLGPGGAKESSEELSQQHHRHRHLGAGRRAGIELLVTQAGLAALQVGSGSSSSSRRRGGLGRSAALEWRWPNSVQRSAWCNNAECDSGCEDVNIPS